MASICHCAVNADPATRLAGGAIHVRVSSVGQAMGAGVVRCQQSGSVPTVWEASDAAIDAARRRGMRWRALVGGGSGAGGGGGGAAGVVRGGA